MSKRQIISSFDLISLTSFLTGLDKPIGNMFCTMVLRTGFLNTSISIKSCLNKFYIYANRRGLYINLGYLSTFFINNKEKLLCEFTLCRVMLFNGHLQKLEFIFPILDFIKHRNRPLILFSNGICITATSAAIINVIRGVIRMCIIKIGIGGRRRTELYLDLSSATGACIYENSYLVNFRTLSMYNLGFASSTIVGRGYTNIISDNSFSDSISTRMRELKSKLVYYGLSYLASIFKESIMRISAGSGILYIPTRSDREFARKSLIFEINLSIIRGILEEGYLPGGCKSFVLLAFSKGFERTLFFTGLWNACLSSVPLTLLSSVSNESGFIFSVLKKGDMPFLGFEIITRRFVDLRREGIIDSSKEFRGILLNAYSGTRCFVNSSSFIIKKNFLC